MKPEDIQLAHYEKCLEENFGTAKEVDWNNPADAYIRYQIMLDLIDFSTKKYKKDFILDFGCGTGSLYPNLKERFPDEEYEYFGVDLSQKMIDVAIQRHGLGERRTARFRTIQSPADLQKDSYDFAICCGTFTEKLSLTHEAMIDYLRETVGELWRQTLKGMAFNIMDPAKCEWQREDLFFLTYDELESKVLAPLGIKDYIIRADYGMREYTVYGYK